MSISLTAGAIAPQRWLEGSLPWARPWHRHLVLGTVALSGGGVLVYMVLALAGLAEARVVESGVFDTAMGAGAAACVLRGMLVRAQRAHWLLVGAALGFWLLGDVYWDAYVNGAPSPPYPSLADLGYLAFYPLFAAAVIVEMRSSERRLRATVTLDALAGALVAGAVGGALLFPTLRQATHGSPSVVATNLAYPLADIVLLALAAVRAALTGEWARGQWTPVMAGLGCFVIADVAFLDQVARDVYAPGSVFDGLWPGAAATFALGALRANGQPRPKTSLRWLLGVPPSLFALAATALLTVDHFERANRVTLWLSTATLVVVAVRLVLGFADNARLLAARERDVLTDVLTGLVNRRASARSCDASSASPRGARARPRFSCSTSTTSST